MKKFFTVRNIVSLVLAILGVLQNTDTVPTVHDAVSSEVAK